MSTAGALRWVAKKCARTTVALGSYASTRPALRSGEAPPRGRVLTYHRFGAVRRDPFCVAVEDFDRQMAWLARQGLAISLADVEGLTSGRRPVRDGSVLVTIDDGCPSLADAALPVLRRWGIPAVAFIPAGEIVAERPAAAAGDAPADARIDWRQLDALVEAGVTIGSHAWTHRSLGRMSAAEAREQAERSREVLARHTGQPVTSFAYPYGTRADYSSGTARILQAAGYRTAFTSQHGAVESGADPFALPRVKVEGGESFWMFRLIVDGGLDAWGWVDRTLWRMQASGR